MQYSSQLYSTLQRNFRYKIQFMSDYIYIIKPDVCVSVDTLMSG